MRVRVGNIRVNLLLFVSVMALFAVFGAFLAHVLGPSLFTQTAAASRPAAFQAAGMVHLGRNPTTWRTSKAMVAIVIDDIGHNTADLQEFLGLGQPLTFAVLPALAQTTKAAWMIRRARREFIIHLPMEPLAFPEKNPGPWPLLLSLSREETARRMAAYIAELPGASGASNHMGSAFTSDGERMEVVLSVLAAHRLFFLNSRTSTGSVPGRIAGRRGIKYLERDVFLDHDRHPRAIEEAFQAVLRRARQRGRAIAIGHPYPQTVAMLRRNLPRARREGIQLVTLSRLLPIQVSRR